MIIRNYIISLVFFLLFVHVHVQSKYIPNICQVCPAHSIGPKPQACPAIVSRFSCDEFKRLGLDVEECFLNSKVDQDNSQSKQSKKSWYTAFVALIAGGYVAQRILRDEDLYSCIVIKPESIAEIDIAGVVDQQVQQSMPAHTKIKNDRQVSKSLAAQNICSAQDFQYLYRLRCLGLTGVADWLQSCYPSRQLPVTCVKPGKVRVMHVRECDNVLADQIKQAVIQKRYQRALQKVTAKNRFDHTFDKQQVDQDRQIADVLTHNTAQQGKKHKQNALKKMIMNYYYRVSGECERLYKELDHYYDIKDTYQKKEQQLKLVIDCNQQRHTLELEAIHQKMCDLLWLKRQVQQTYQPVLKSKTCDTANDPIVHNQEKECNTNIPQQEETGVGNTWTEANKEQQAMLDDYCRLEAELEQVRHAFRKPVTRETEVNATPDTQNQSLQTDKVGYKNMAVGDTWCDASKDLWQEFEAAMLDSKDVVEKLQDQLAQVKAAVSKKPKVSTVGTGPMQCAGQNKSVQVVLPAFVPRFLDRNNMMSEDVRKGNQDELLAEQKIIQKQRKITNSGTLPVAVSRAATTSSASSSSNDQLEGTVRLKPPGSIQASNMNFEQMLGSAKIALGNLQQKPLNDTFKTTAQWWMDRLHENQNIMKQNQASYLEQRKADYERVCKMVQGAEAVHRANHGGKLNNAGKL